MPGSALTEQAKRLFELASAGLTRWRTPLTIAALLCLLLGTVWSVSHLGIGLSELKLQPLLLIVLAVLPLTLLYSAVNMVVMARASGARMPLSLALKTSVYATLAELLPIPGGAIVRTASLRRAGSSMGASVDLVISFALLWIACAAVGAGLAVVRLGDAGYAVLALAGLAVAACFVWIAHRYSFRVALIALLLRIVGIGLIALRLGLAFAMLAIPFAWSDTLAFTFAIIAGTASAIVPGGLGLSESLAAAFAAPLQVAPAGAFLAVAATRVLGLGFNAAIAALFALGGLVRGPDKAAHHG